MTWIIGILALAILIFIVSGKIRRPRVFYDMDEGYHVCPKCREKGMFDWQEQSNAWRCTGCKKLLRD